MKVALGLGMSEEACQFARQLGVRHAVSAVSEGPKGTVELDTFFRTREFFEAAGLRLEVLEGFPHSLYHDAIWGLPERDQEIENVCISIRNMGRAGIPVLSYQWMPLGGMTTSVVDVRGGAVARRFDMAEALRSPAAALDWRNARLYRLPDRPMGREEVWDHLTYFLERVVPVAEEAGVKLAMHPDDPPITSFLGVERILYDVAGLQRLVDTVPSPSNGLNFCQGCVSSMAGVDVVAAIRHFGAQGRIFFAHFRDTRGTVPKFDEVFMDDGDTDMFAAMKAYVESGVDVVIRADHGPGVVGDKENAGRGTAFQIGYMTGMVQAAEAALRSSAQTKGG